MTIKQNSNPTVNEEELKKSAAQLGQKLGLLIAVLFPKPEEQQAMMVLVEKMSPPQLMELTETLEQKYLEAFGKAIDDDYKAQVQTRVDEYKVEQESVNKQTLAELAALEEEIKAEK